MPLDVESLVKNGPVFHDVFGPTLQLTNILLEPTISLEEVELFRASSRRLTWIAYVSVQGYAESANRSAANVLDEAISRVRPLTPLTRQQSYQFGIHPFFTWSSQFNYYNPPEFIAGVVALKHLIDGEFAVTPERLATFDIQIQECMDECTRGPKPKYDGCVIDCMARKRKEQSSSRAATPLHGPGL